MRGIRPARCQQGEVSKVSVPRQSKMVRKVHLQSPGSAWLEMGDTVDINEQRAELFAKGWVSTCNLIAPRSVVEDAASTIRGNAEYQRDCVWGNFRWSGADLKGNASKWGASYDRSRFAALAALRKAAAEAGLTFYFREGSAQNGPGRVIIC